MPQNSNSTIPKGRSFKGRDLTGADFSHADIRGINFTNAILNGANFTHAKAGLPLLWKLILFSGVLLLALMSGYIAGYSSTLPVFINYVLTNEGTVGKAILLLIAVVSLGIFITLSLRKGLGAAVGAFAITGVAVIALVAGMGTGDITGIAVIELLAIGGAIVSTILAALVTTVCRILIKLSWGAIALPTIILIAGSIPGILEVPEMDNQSRFDVIMQMTVCSLLLLVLLGLSLFIGWRASQHDSRYALLQTLAIAICTSQGTKFKNADLTNANFSEATLWQTDLRQAKLKGTRLTHAKGLEYSRLNRTYLENPKIRQLVIWGHGQDQQFDQLDLRGVNLREAKLTDASFIGTNLSEADLQDADLSRAKLVRTQLYRANLNKACLTGAYIEDWGISIETQFIEVRCDYIYMHLPTNDDPDPCRKPDNRNEIFEPGDFSDFITPIIKTLDLYRQQNVDPRNVATTYKTIDLFHHQGIDPSAAAIAFQHLAEQHPDAGIEVVALEGRGNDKIRLQARVAKDADRSELSNAYFETYSQLKSLPVADLQSLLTGVAEKDAQIRRLEAMLETAIQQPKFYVETYQNQGEFVMAQNNQGSISIGNVGGNVSGLAAAGETLSISGSNLGEVSGSVTQTINQLPDQPNSPDEENLKALLTQLQTLIESESELSDEDKIEALEQVKVLAEASQSSEDGPLKKAAKTAMKILKGTAAALPNATQLVEGLNKLLPAIATLLVLI